MFWGPVKLPVNDEERQWVEKSFHWLLKEFGEGPFLKRPTILPEARFFPDKYEATEACVTKLVERVCTYMEIDPSIVDVCFLVDRDDTAAKHRTGNEDQYSGAAGLYFTKASTGSRKRIAINVSAFKNPVKLVATIAHELGHVILLGGGKVSNEDKEHEFLTDLLTVFYGFGIFNANAAFQFSQWRDSSHQGWNASRQGYLSEEMFAYALAVYAWLRGETNPKWAGHLAINVGHHFKTCRKYLEKGGEISLRQLQTSD